MRPEPRRIAAAAGALAALLLTACGAAKPPLRIGVVVDCQGAYRELRGVALSGAELPLLRNGARLRGRGPGEGTTPAKVSGRAVELLSACSETGEFAALTAAVRRLVERERADAVVVGGRFTVDGLVLRDIARLHPSVAFLAATPGPREVTLRGAPPNLYRVVPDLTQATAGLGTYAYRRLGWRRAAVALEDWVGGWGPEAAFVREFCALGGRITGRLLLAPGAPAAEAAKIPRSVDGVAVLGTPLFADPPFLRRLAARFSGPGRLLLGPDLTSSADLLATVGRPLSGVAGSTYGAPGGAAGSEFDRAFPGSPPGRGDDPLVLGYSASVEAVLAALQRSGGDPGIRRARLRRELARLRAVLATGPARMAPDRQAVVSARIARIAAPGAGAAAGLTAVRTIRNVDPSLGGLIGQADSPAEAGQPCRRAQPPPWAVP
ncbi:MAG: ABC transporter substrate-binding protein [Solirubrobacteraceae bacterium]